MSPPGVFAVQCPNAKCRKYLLVEKDDQGKVVPCLLCKTPIRVGGSPPAPSRVSSPASPFREISGSAEFPGCPCGCGRQADSGIAATSDRMASTSNDSGRRMNSAASCGRSPSPAKRW